RRGRSSAREWTPRSGTDPAHVGSQRVDVVRGEEAAEGCHLDRLATKEEPADRVLGDSPDLALRDPVPELLVAAHEIVEVRTPVARHVALERARVGYAAGAERTVAGEAAELRGEVCAAGGERLLGQHLAGGRAQIGDQVLELGRAQVAAERRHAVRGRLHAGPVVRVLAL